MHSISYRNVTDSGGFRGRFRHAPPYGPNFFSISCSFSQKLAKSYVGTTVEAWRPLLREILDRPLTEMNVYNLAGLSNNVGHQVTVASK